MCCNESKGCPGTWVCRGLEEAEDNSPGRHLSPTFILHAELHHPEAWTAGAGDHSSSEVRGYRECHISCMAPHCSDDTHLHTVNSIRCKEFAKSSIKVLPRRALVEKPEATGSLLVFQLHPMQVGGKKACRRKSERRTPMESACPPIQSPLHRQVRLGNGPLVTAEGGRLMAPRPRGKTSV